VINKFFNRDVRASMGFFSSRECLRVLLVLIYLNFN